MEDSAPGFRFFPTEEELVSFYLINKLEHTRSDQLHRVIPEVNIYELEPWQLPHHAGEVCRGDKEQWFFFAPRQMREAKGGRPNRTTSCGYWKATGSPGYVYSSDNRVIGEKKTMVFYMGKAPTGRKTKWKMTEYKAIAEDLEEAVVASCTTSVPKLRHEYSVCRVYVIPGNFTAFDRRPPGVLTSEMMDGQVVENVPNMIPQNTHLVGETSQWEPASAAIEDGREGSEEPDMETLGQYPQYFSWEQMDWL